eukprot:1073989-Prymnesium_polylepis.1
MRRLPPRQRGGLRSLGRRRRARMAGAARPAAPRKARLASRSIPLRRAPPPPEGPTPTPSRSRAPEGDAPSAAPRRAPCPPCLAARLLPAARARNSLNTLILRLLVCTRGLYRSA